MLVHGGPRVDRDDGFRGWGTVSHGAVRPDSIVVVVPFLDQDLGFAHLAVEEFIPKPGVEALAIRISFFRPTSYNFEETPYHIHI